MRLSNPKYFQLARLQKPTRWCQPFVEVPTLTNRYIPAPHTTTIKLRPAQQVVFDEVQDCSSCLVEFSTGSGKTVLAIALHQAWGGRTLVACHSLQLARQFAEEFAKFIRVTPTFYCDGKHDQSGDVVITTHTTLRQKYKHFDEFNNLVIDEADLFASPQSLKALTSFESTRKLGLTGTVQIELDICNDSENGILALIYGRYVKGEFNLQDTPFKRAYYKKYNKIYTENGATIHPKDWIEFRGVLDDDIDRKKAQLQFVKENTEPDNYTLVLFDRVADVLSFAPHFDYAITGDTKKDDRERMLKEFEEKGGTLVATHSIIGRGYDNKKVDKVFILFPLRQSKTLVQIIGRLVRKLEGKISALYLWSDNSLSFQFRDQKKLIKDIYQVDVEEV